MKTNVNDFKFTINTNLGTGADIQLPLPPGQSYDFWWNPGDGSADIHVMAHDDANAYYAYSGHGTYQISICTRMGDKCGGWTSGVDKLKIISVDQWGDIGVDYAVEAFYTCSNLASIPSSQLTWTNISSMLRFFGQCINLATALPSGMLDLMVNVTDATSLFLNCTSIPGSIPAEFCRYMPLTLVDNMFYQCWSLSAIGEDVFYYNSSILQYSYVFYRCRNLALPTRMFNLSNLSAVTTFAHFMNALNTSYSNTGTIQDIWNYATSATSTNAFLNQTALTNYASIPNGWKGL